MKNTFRLFSMAALAFVMAACSSDDSVLEPSTPAEAGKLHFTATVAAPDNGAGTRTTYTEVTSGDDAGTINVAWKVGDEIVVANGDDGYLDVVKVSSVNANGSAVISGTITKPTDSNTKVNLLYPCSIVKKEGQDIVINPDILFTGVTFDGTLASIAEKADYRVAMFCALEVSDNNATLKDYVTFESSQIAIWKLTLQDNAATPAAINATALTVNFAGNETKVEPTSATNVLYVPIRAGYSDVTITATTADGAYTYSKSDVTLNNGMYYQSTVTMAPATIPVTVTVTLTYPIALSAVTSDYVGSVLVTAVTPDNATDKTYTRSSDKTNVATVGADGKVNALAGGTAKITATANDGSGVKATCTVTVTTVAKTLAQATAEDIGKIAGKDGKIYDTKDAAEAMATGNAVAMIAYVGSSTDNATYQHGLALALTDESDDGITWEAAKTACTNKNTSAAVTSASWMLPSKAQWETMGVTVEGYATLCNRINSVGGSNLKSVNYWSSTYSDSPYVWVFHFGTGNWSEDNDTSIAPHVRACLAF